jgi:hypothetical protein
MKWYAEVTVNGKTGSRPVSMYYSIPYYKAWLEIFLRWYGQDPNT